MSSISKNSPLLINIYLLLTVSFNQFVAAQNLTEQKIDSIQKQVVWELRRSGQFKEAIQTSLNAIDSSEAINYERGVILGRLQIFGLLISLGKYHDALEYSRSAEKLLKKESHPDLYLRLLDDLGRCYTELHMFEKAIESYDKAIRFHKQQGLDDKEHLPNILLNKYAIFSRINEKDSALLYLHRAIKLNPTPNYYINMAHFQIFYENNLDSAKYYLDNSLELMDNKDDTMFTQTIWNILNGHLYKQKKDYNFAIEYYTKGLELAQKVNLIRQKLEALESLADTYNLLGLPIKSHDYLLEYTRLNDSITSVRTENINSEIDVLIAENKTNLDNTKRRFKKQKTEIIIISLIVIILFFGLYKYNFRRKLNNIQAKEDLSQNKAMEKKAQNFLPSNSFNEIIELASTNSPQFLKRFQEVYSEFWNNLLKKNPNLVNTELQLSAMIWLNFSTKEIARFLNVQPNTIQVRKYRLRKRLGIAKNIDIYRWMENL